MRIKRKNWKIAKNIFAAFIVILVLCIIYAVLRLALPHFAFSKAIAEHTARSYLKERYDMDFEMKDISVSPTISGSGEDTYTVYFEKDAVYSATVILAADFGVVSDNFTNDYVDIIVQEKFAREMSEDGIEGARLFSYYSTSYIDELYARAASGEDIFDDYIKNVEYSVAIPIADKFDYGDTDRHACEITDIFTVLEERKYKPESVYISYEDKYSLRFYMWEFADKPYKERLELVKEKLDTY